MRFMALAVVMFLALTGGAYAAPGVMMLEVDEAALRKERIAELNAAVRVELARAPVIASRRQATDGELTIRLSDPASADDAAARLRGLKAAGLSYAVDHRDGVFVVALPREMEEAFEADALAHAEGVLRMRLQFAHVSGAVKRDKANRLTVEVPDFSVEQLKALAPLLTQVGRVSMHLEDAAANPSDFTLGISSGGRIMLPAADGGPMVLLEAAVLTGEDILSAEQQFDWSNRPNIEFRLNPDGARRFGKMTTDNVGKVFAIVIDKRVLTAPYIVDPITGGTGQISGIFTTDEARRIAAIIGAGALQAPLKLVSITGAP